MQHYLKYPDLGPRGDTKSERATSANLRNWTIKHFDIVENQIYHEPEKNKATRGIMAPRYAACEWDGLVLIQRVSSENVMMISFFPLFLGFPSKIYICLLLNNPLQSILLSFVVLVIPTMKPEQ
jgi:hypothetical protein